MAFKTWYEIVSKNIIPTLRAIVADILVKKYGFTQVKAASILGVTQPAISNYLYSRRGSKGMIVLKNDPYIMSMLEKMAKCLVYRDYSCASDTLDAILYYIRRNRKLLKTLVGEKYLNVPGLYIKDEKNNEKNKSTS